MSFGNASATILEAIMGKTDSEAKAVVGEVRDLLERRRFVGAGLLGAAGGLAALMGRERRSEAFTGAAGVNTVSGGLPGASVPGTLESASSTTLIQSALLAPVLLAPSTTYFVEAVIAPWALGTGGFQFNISTNGQVNNTAGQAGVHCMGFMVTWIHDGTPSGHGPSNPLTVVAFDEISGVKSFAMQQTAHSSTCMRFDGLITTTTNYTNTRGSYPLPGLSFVWGCAQVPADTDPNDPEKDATVLGENSWWSVTAL